MKELLAISYRLLAAFHILSRCLNPPVPISMMEKSRKL
jgi:hypothetical protein